MKGRLIFAVIAGVIGIGTYVALANTTPVSAAAIPNSNLTSLNNVQNYIKNNQPGYMTYIKGSQILYRANGTGGWKIISGGTDVTEANRSSQSDEDNACTTVIQNQYTFRTRYRSNMGGGCGTRNATADYTGGRIMVDPPDDLPVALWLTDIDSSNEDWQQMIFTSASIQYVYTPNNEAKFTYSGGTFTTNGTGLCDEVTNPRCNAIILLRGASFHIKVRMRSPQGLMEVNNTVPLTYRTLTLNPNGGSVTDNGATSSTLLWSHPSGSNLLREYETGATASSFPTPTRAGYTFDGWYTAATGGTRRTSTAMSGDVTLYAHWAPNWSLTPTATVGGGTSVGDQLTWTHRITNSGPGTTDTAITYNAQNQGHLGTNTVQSWSATGIPGTGTNWRQQTTTYTITQADVGQNLCRRTTVSPQSWNNTGTVNSANACQQIPYDYNLIPTITRPASDTVIESDTRVVPVEGRVTNNGPTKSQTNINWRISQIKYPRGTTIPNRTGGTGSDACSFFTGGNCTLVTDGTEAGGYGYGTVGPSNPANYQLYTGDGDLTDDEPGTKICYAMSVQNYNATATDWRHSALHCLVVGKEPKVQVWGGDVMAGRTFSGGIEAGSKVETSLTTKATGNSFGSFSEYGILAPAAINLMASGSGLSGGHTSATQTNWSAYSFTRSGTSYGQYAFTNTQLPDVTSNFPTASAITETNFNLSTTAKGRHIRPTDAAVRNITLTANPGNTLGDNEWLVINAIGHNITIANNLIYANAGHTDARRLPQLIILADNITINSNVTQVDAWLIAKNDTTTAGVSRGAFGAIATCDQQSGASGSNGLAQWLATPDGSGGTNYDSSPNSRLTLDHCSQALRINGPVMASKLYLRRTAGSGAGTAAGDPAEVINLRPDAYLWAREHMSLSHIYQTVNTTELPPRY